MTKSSAIGHRAEGMIWVLASAAMFWLVLSGPIERIFAAAENIRGAELLSAQHADRVARPITTSPALQFRSYVYTGLQTEALGPGDIQAALITLTKENRAKLLDLRVLENDTSIEHLEAKRFRLDIEGDLIAITEVVRNFGAIGQPVHIDDLSLSPVGQHDRPDRRLRASFEISFWELKASS